MGELVFNEVFKCFFIFFKRICLVVQYLNINYKFYLCLAALLSKVKTYRLEKYIFIFAYFASHFRWNFNSDLWTLVNLNSTPKPWTRPGILNRGLLNRSLHPLNHILCVSNPENLNRIPQFLSPVSCALRFYTLKTLKTLNPWNLMFS